MPGGAELLDKSGQGLEQAGGAAGRQAGRLDRRHYRDAPAVEAQVLGRLVDVGLVLEQDVERPGGRCGIDGLDPEQQQGPGPIERFGHRRRLFQLQIADGAHDADHLIGEGLGDARHPGQHDLLLPLEVGIVDVQEQAAPLQRLRQLSGVVGGQEDQRDLGGAHGPELRDRHLIVREDLQEQGLGLHLDPVDLVDQQHDRLLGADGLQQGPSQQEGLGEDVLLDVLPLLAAGRFADALGLDAQELLLVVPLVEGLRLVQPLVALQADQPGVEHLGHRLGQLRLAGAGRAFDQDRLAEPLGQVHDAGDPFVGEVGDPSQSFTDDCGGLEAGGCNVAHRYGGLSRIGARAQPSSLPGGRYRPPTGGSYLSGRLRPVREAHSSGREQAAESVMRPAEPGAQGEALDLAGGGLGELLDDVDLPWAA